MKNTPYLDIKKYTNLVSGHTYSLFYRIIKCFIMVRAKQILTFLTNYLFVFFLLLVACFFFRTAMMMWMG